MKASLKVAVLVVVLIFTASENASARKSISNTYSGPAVELTPEERALLAEHPEITIIAVRGGRQRWMSLAS